jgi:hypothetical protein
VRNYTLCLPVWYRGVDETEWHTGLSRSVSTTGALIHADEPGVPSDKLIVAIELPTVPGCLVGRGRVIRLVTSEDATAPPTFAVQVPRYRLNSLNLVLHELDTSG